MRSFCRLRPRAARRVTWIRRNRSMAEPACHRSYDSLGFSHTFKTVEVFVEVQLEIAFHQQHNERENAKQILNVVRTRGTIHAIQNFN